AGPCRRGVLGRAACAGATGRHHGPPVASSDAAEPVAGRDLQRDSGPGRDRGLRYPADRGGRHVRLLDPGDTECASGAGPVTAGGCAMNILVYLVPMALLLGLTGLAAFMWSLSSGQYDDVEGAALRILDNDDIEVL